MDALTCLTTRRSEPRLVEPAPDDAALRSLIDAASVVPDHGRLRPWRFVVVRGAGLRRLGEAFAAAHAQRDPATPDDELRRTAGKPLRAPAILTVVAAPRDSPKIPVVEQTASAACAAHAVCLAAHALGYGAMWRTGWYGDAPLVRAFLGLAPSESVAGWIYLGTVPAGTTTPPRADTRPPVQLIDR